MRIFDVPLEDCERIASGLGIRFEGSDKSNSAGHRTSGTLRADAASNPYPRLSSSYFRLKSGERRKLRSIVCWHGYRDFMRGIFADFPNARIATHVADYRGSADFESKYADTGYKNIGPPIAPVIMADCCYCADAGYCE